MSLNRMVLASLVLSAAACTVTRQVQPAQFIPEHSPQVVWVTYTDNSYVPVAQPQISGDTLKGTWAGLAEPVTIPFSQIQTVQAKIRSPKRTAMLAVVLGLAAGGVAYTIATAGTGGTFGQCPTIKGTVQTECCPTDTQKEG